jgi:hypothetical protein
MQSSQFRTGCRYQGFLDWTTYFQRAGACIAIRLQIGKRSPGQYVNTNFKAAYAPRGAFIVEFKTLFCKANI